MASYSEMSEYGKIDVIGVGGGRAPGTYGHRYWYRELLMTIRLTSLVPS